MRGTWSAGPGDDQARFLADLRALRDSAAIGYDELAARAHYPSDVLKEAENGPSLPSLPILSAYVRACEGDVLDWEERWRRLNPDVADDPDLPVRPAGASAAAVAGARAGVGVAPPDVYDPERIRAALRGDQARSEQPGRSSSAPGVVAPGRDADHQESLDGDRYAGSGVGAGSGAAWGANSGGGAAWGANAGWDAAADTGITSANGNHSASHGIRGPFEAAFTTDISSPAEHTGSAQAEEFSWLKKSMPEPRPADGEPAWREPAESGFSWSEPADTGLGTPGAAETAPPEPAGLSMRHADEVASQERTDFWSKPVAPVPADPPRPVTPRSEEPAITRASWSVPADTTTESARRAAADAAGSGFSGTSTLSGVSSGVPGISGVSGTAQSRCPARSATQTAVSDRDDRRQDRLFPVRLLMVVVMAALIGSVLVLLLK